MSGCVTGVFFFTQLQYSGFFRSKEPNCGCVLFAEQVCWYLCGSNSSIFALSVSR
jgi:hypothetical protein